MDEFMDEVVRRIRPINQLEVLPHPRPYAPMVEDRRFAATPLVGSRYAQNLLNDRWTGATSEAPFRKLDVRSNQRLATERSIQGRDRLPIFSAPDPELQYAWEEALYGR